MIERMYPNRKSLYQLNKSKRKIYSDSIGFMLKVLIYTGNKSPPKKIEKILKVF